MDPRKLQLRKRTRVLVVDDDLNCRLLVATLLQLEGYATTTAGDGFHALECVAAEEPNLILLDLQMPLLDGCDVLADVRARNPQARVVIVSGASGAKEQALAMGANAFLAKPFDLDALLTTVETVSAASSQARGNR